MQQRHILATSIGLLSAVLPCGERRAIAGAGVVTEAVNTFNGPGYCNNGADLANAIADASGFMSTMLNTSWPYQNLGYYNKHQWTEQQVWTSDFYDPQLSGAPDNDTNTFDENGTAFSYVAAHGGNVSGDTAAPSNTCAPGPNCQPCFTQSQCTSPPPGTRMPSMCRRIPGDPVGSCSYSTDQRSISIANCTQGAAGRNGQVVYNNTAVAWGEAPGRSWRGAGTNGGTNVVQLHISHPHASNRGHELFNAYGGAIMIASPLIHSGGDTAVVASRGAYWAAQKVNPNSSVAQGYLAAAASIASGLSFPCCDSFGRGPNGATCTDTNNFGRGQGVNGCGGSVVGALDSTLAYAQGDLAFTWYQVQSDGNKSLGRAYYWEVVSCNYNCNIYPFAW